jgi:hypothetical protein
MPNNIMGKNRRDTLEVRFREPKSHFMVETVETIPFFSNLAPALASSPSIGSNQLMFLLTLFWTLLPNKDVLLLPPNPSPPSSNLPPLSHPPSPNESPSFFLPP